MSGENNSKDIKDLILELLKTTEELKSTVPPLIKGQDYGQRALEAHTDSLERLMKALLTLRRDQELIRQELQEIKEYEVDSKMYEELEERVRLLEIKRASEIAQKVKLGKEISNSELQHLELLVKSRSGESSLWLTLGLVYLRKDQSEKAFECFERALQIDPKYAHAWCAKGWALQRLQKHEEALKAFEIARKLFKCPTVFRNEAISMAILGKNEQALNLVDLAIQGDKEDARSWALKGRILHEMNRDTEALGCFEKALELEPDLIIALNQKGIVLSSLGFYEKSLASFKRISQLLPHSNIAWHNMALAVENLGKDEEAIKYLDKAIDLNPKYACSYCARGRLKNALGDSSGALDDFKKAFEIGLPKNCGLYFACRAVVLRNLKRYQEALKVLDKGLAIRSDEVDLWTEKALVLARLKREDESKKYVEKAIDCQPKDAHTLNAIAYTLFELKEFSRALEFARKAVEMDPNLAANLDTLACILFKLGQDTEALELFQNALNLRRTDAEITWLVLAELYEKVGKNKEAEKIREEHPSKE